MIAIACGCKPDVIRLLTNSIQLHGLEKFEVVLSAGEIIVIFLKNCWLRQKIDDTPIWSWNNDWLSCSRLLLVKFLWSEEVVSVLLNLRVLKFIVLWSSEIFFKCAAMWENTLFVQGRMPHCPCFFFLESCRRAIWLRSPEFRNSFEPTTLRRYLWRWGKIECLLRCSPTPLHKRWPSLL